MLWEEENPMTDPVIVAAAYLLLTGQVAGQPPPPAAVAIPLNCQLTMDMNPHPAFEDEPHAHHVRHLTPGQHSPGHLTVRLRPSPRPQPVYVHHRRHHHR
jgi:hypothetical protein